VVRAPEVVRQRGGGAPAPQRCGMRAASAALEDTRFPHTVSVSELPVITIEISVLTLRHLARKAGLPEDARKKAEYRVYEAIVFGEDEHR
jgi:AMMECR1 domain-containing protein